MSSKKKRLLAPEVLEATTDVVFALAQAQGVRAALAGGFALQQLGSLRLTGDVDFLVERELEGLKEVGQLSFGGQKLETPEGVPVDAILRSDEYADLYDEALNVAPIDQETGWRTISPEYLLAMKMAAGRAKDRVDLEFLIQGHLIDEGKTLRIVRKHLGLYAARVLAHDIRVLRFLGEET